MQFLMYFVRVFAFNPYSLPLLHTPSAFAVHTVMMEFVSNTVANTSSQGIDNTESDGLCKRCQSLPWRRLDSPRPTEAEIKITIDTLLNCQGCQVCRLFNWVNSRMTSRLNPVSLVLDDRPSEFPFHHRLYHQFYRGSDCGITWLVSSLSPECPKVQAELQKYFPSRADFQAIKRWITACQFTHGPACRPATVIALQQFKLIDCYYRTILSAPEDAEFVALSYVWGQSHASFTHSVSVLSDLPRTIEDSISATLLLGYRYVWVNRYVSINSSLNSVLAT
jgi:hypothetical protein